MKKFAKALVVLVSLLSFASTGYAFYLTKDFVVEPVQCEAGWCDVARTTVTSDGNLIQTPMKAWVGE